MIFNSLAFVIFATAFFAGWAVIHVRGSATTSCGYLVAGSLVFYGWSNQRQVIVLVAVALASYVCGRWLQRRPNHRGVLAVALGCAIAPLIAFKYLDFLLAQVNSLVGLADRELTVQHLGFHVPLGLGFFALSATSYAIDVYTGECEASTNVVQHTAFLTMFPLLISGPIVRGAELLPQLRERAVVGDQARWEGLKRITYGLAKKCLVADSIAGFTNEFYDERVVSSGLWWLVAILFAIQVYADFSGYTDIALGIGQWLGLKLPENFRQPFFSTSLREFWNRWNLSFSTWLRDYIYFPLARRWTTTAGAIAAVLTTFVVSGIWHGAAWTFVVWGLAHGVFLCLEHWSKWDHRIKKLPGGSVLATVIVFVTVTLLMVVFRSRDLDQAWWILKTMFSFKTVDYSWIGRDHTTFWEPTWWLFPITFVLVELRHVIKFDDSRFAAALRRTNLGWVGIALLLLACVYLRGSTTSFIYAAF